MADMMHFSIKLADLTIFIHTISPRTYCCCLNYLSNDNTPDFHIYIDEHDVQMEYDRNGFNTSRVYSTYLETMAASRKIVEKALDFDIIMMHGAVISTNNGSFLFSAPSGTGKTTHIKKWISNIADSYVVNGDKPLIKICNKRVIAYGTPWCGKEQMGRNTKAIIKSIVFMERAENNLIEQISFAEALPLLLQQTYRPNDEEKMRKTLLLIQRINDNVSFWRFKCNNFKDDCFEVAYNALVRNQK